MMNTNVIGTSITDASIVLNQSFDKRPNNIMQPEDNSKPNHEPIQYQDQSCFTSVNTAPMLQESAPPTAMSAYEAQ
jgi:hypothetical protein